MISLGLFNEHVQVMMNQHFHSVLPTLLTSLPCSLPSFPPPFLWFPPLSPDSSHRQNSIDGMGWSPTRRLKDVIWGLSSLFLDLCNFDDPLNFEAAEHYERDKDGFRAKVKDWINKYAARWWLSLSMGDTLGLDFVFTNFKKYISNSTSLLSSNRRCPYRCT